MGMYCRLDEVTPSELKRCLISSKAISKPSPERELDQLADFIATAVKTDPNYMQKLKEGFQKIDLDIPRELTPEMKAQIAQTQALIMERIKSGPKSDIFAKPASKKKTFKCISTLSLEKEWHVLHYALNGKSEATRTPLGQAILGGREMPNVALSDYGPPRYLKPPEVKLVATALGKVDPSILVSKLNAADAKEKSIYLAHTITRPHDWDHLPELFLRFREFYKTVASHKNAVITYIT